MLKQARQKTRLYCAGCFVEKIVKARASCVQFVATDVKRKFSGNRTRFHKVICVVGVCSGDFIFENELSTRRQEKASCQNNIFVRRPGFKSNCSRGKLCLSKVWPAVCEILICYNIICKTRKKLELVACRRILFVHGFSCLWNCKFWLCWHFFAVTIL